MKYNYKTDTIFPYNVIVGNTIENVWRDTLWCCARNGYNYQVNKGSYKGQTRRQLENAMIIINEPYTRPLAPRMPEASELPPPTTEEDIENYFMYYILDGEKKDNDYLYADYIKTQLPDVVSYLRYSKGGTNQAVITVGNDLSIQTDNPPCLKIIDFKVVDNRLDMHVYFRSNDLYPAFPCNLGGLQLLKEYLLTLLNYQFEDGKIYYYSSGLHLYDFCFDLVNQLNVDKITHGQKSNISEESN